MYVHRAGLWMGPHADQAGTLFVQIILKGGFRSLMQLWFEGVVGEAHHSLKVGMFRIHVTFHLAEYYRM